jgi:hypothetical protein
MADQTPCSFLKIVAHNLKLAANIDHMRDDTSNAPSHSSSLPIVPEHGGSRLVWQRRFSVQPSVLFKFKFVRINRRDRLECLASSAFGVDDTMTVKLNVKIFDLSQVIGFGSDNGRTVDKIDNRNQNTIKIQAVISR